MSIRKVKSLGAIVLVLTLSALALLFTLGLCRAQVISATDDQNLIENPGFEEGDPGDDSPDYWENGAGQSFATYDWTDSYNRTGDYSVKIYNYQTTVGWWQSTPPVNITATEAYTFSGWVTTKGVNGRAFLSLFYRNSDGKLIEIESSDVTTSDSNVWVPVQTATPIVIPSGTTTVYLRCQLDGRGTAWFDDVALRPVPDFVNLEIRKQAEPVTVKPGEQLTYVIAYSNAGNLKAEDVFITDTLPTSVTLDYASPLTYTHSPPHLWWHIDNGLAGDNMTHYVTVVVTVSNGVTEGQWLTNTATIVAGNAISDTGWVTTEVTLHPKLILEKQSGSKLVDANKPLSYTLTYRNVGGKTATGLRLTDNLTSGTKYESSAGVSATLVTTSGNLLVWDLADLKEEEERSIVITVTVLPTASDQTLLNCAELEDDRKEGDSDCTEEVRVYPTRLGIKKSVNPSVVIAGQWVTYTLEYSDNKSGVAYGVVLTDYLPSGLSFVKAITQPGGPPISSTIIPGTIIPDIIRWRLGDLKGDGTPGYITVVVTVSKSITEVQWLTNTATIAAEGAIASTDWITIQARPISLGLKKRVNSAVARPGQRLTYTLEYSDDVNGAAQGVVLTDRLPLGLTLISATRQTEAQDDPRILRWSLGDFAGSSIPGRITVVVTVSGGVTEDQELTNVATITAKNAIPATDQISVQIRPFMVYLPIMMRNYAPPSLHLSTITVDKDVAYWGDTLYYTITLTNSGTTEAITPTMISKIPVQSTIITGSISNGGKVEDGAVRWDGRVDPGKSQVITFTVQLTDSDCAFVAANQVTITAGSAIWTLDLRETQVRCVKDGGFEGGDDNWGEWYHGYQGEELSRSIQSEYQYSGEYAALLGDPEYLCSNVPIGSAWVTQTVLVPNTNDPKLSFWYRIFTQDRNAAFDRFEVYVKGIRVFLKAKDSGRYGCNLEEEEMDLGWQPKTINLRDYFNPDEIKGQFVIIRFENWNYPDNWFNTYTYLDDVQMIR